MFKLTRLLQLVLIVLYPLSAHLSIYLQMPSIALAVLAGLVLSYVNISTLRKHPFTIIVVLGLTIAVIAASLVYKSFVLLYLPPIFITLFFFCLFARTLLPGHEPLVTTFARVIYAENTDDVKIYTRRVTLAWSLFFVLMLLEIILLSLFATPKIWSLFCNILNYTFIAIFFLAEYAYRQYRFKNKNSLWAMLKYFAQHDIKHLSKQKTLASHYPLIAHNDLNKAFLVKPSGLVRCTDFLKDAKKLARQLPKQAYIINLCTDRYYFTLLFSAALITKKVTLLPNNHSPKTLDQLQTQFHDSIVLDDDNITHFLNEEGTSDTLDLEIPQIESSQLATIVYTSGSTGEPSPWKKYWGDLVAHCQQTSESLGLEKHDNICVVATVAAQHMYGLEHSVILPMQMGYSMFSEKPFFEEDIRSAIDNCKQAVVLFSTPIHLKQFAYEGLQFPPVKRLISSTAKLAPESAPVLETVFSTKLFEIYGCTEAGAIATRRSALTDQWKLMADYALKHDASGDYVIVPDFLNHSEKAIKLSDAIEVLDHQHFLLYGRLHENINIAGKRMSLSDLNIKLNSIDGVEDGIFHLPPMASEITRLMALVVAPSISAQDIRKALHQMVDSAFLPRPIIKIDSLPRNSLGKIDLDSLQELLIQQGAKL